MSQKIGYTDIQDGGTLGASGFFGCAFQSSIRAIRRLKALATCHEAFFMSRRSFGRGKSGSAQTERRHRYQFLPVWLGFAVSCEP